MLPNEAEPELLDRAFDLVQQSSALAAPLSIPVPRGRAPEITGYEERRARETVSALIEKGLLLAKGPRSTLTLGFPMFVLERWLPTLYPIDPATIP